MKLIVAPVLLDFYDSCGKLRTMGITARTGIITVICKKNDKKILHTHFTFKFRLQNLYSSF